MARNIGVDLEDSQSFRGVVLYLYPGVHNLELKTYTNADADEFLYHEALAYGPYSTRSPATSQVTQQLKIHETKSYNTMNPGKGNGWYGDYTEGPGSIPEVTGFVEAQIPSWNTLAGTIRTA